MPKVQTVLNGIGKISCIESCQRVCLLLNTWFVFKGFCNIIKIVIIFKCCKAAKACSRYAFYKYS